MLIVTIANFVAIFIILLGRVFGREKQMLIFVTIALICFYGIRTDYGNDIPAYMDIFDRVSSYSVLDVLNNIYDERIETGWQILNVLFAPLGWQTFIFFLTIIQIGTISWMICKFVAPQYYWLIFAIFIFDSNALLTGLSMLRQSLAISICMWGIPALIDRRLAVPIICIVIASTIHTSALIMLLVLPLPFLNRINKYLIIIIYLAVIAFLFLFDTTVTTIMSNVLNYDTFERYDIYANEELNIGTGLGILLKTIIYTYILYIVPKNDKVLHFFALLAMLSTIFTPFIYVVPLVGRLCFYFTIPSIICYQVLLRKDFNRPINSTLICLLLYIFINGYFGFFASPVWQPYFSVYHTIFD